MKYYRIFHWFSDWVRFPVPQFVWLKWLKKLHYLLLTGCKSFWKALSSESREFKFLWNLFELANFFFTHCFYIIIIDSIKITALKFCLHPGHNWRPLNFCKTNVYGPEIKTYILGTCIWSWHPFFGYSKTDNMAFKTPHIWQVLKGLDTSYRGLNFKFPIFLQIS